jgi:hypothetical protein
LGGTQRDYAPVISLAQAGPMMPSREKCNLPNANRQINLRTETMTFSIPCKIHATPCGIHFAKEISAKSGKSKPSILFMTTQESKLANELERRLREHATQTKKGIYRSEIKAEGLENIARTPLRIHQQMIQRAQFYTGDA